MPTRIPTLEELKARGNLPRHVAIIMDGNGRWAKARGVPRLLGHRAGRESVREAVRGCAALGVDVLTLYTFSTENWKRPAREVSALMTMLRESLRRERVELKANNVRLQVIGRAADLPAPVRRAIEEAQEYLAGSTGMLLNLALSYGGRVELVDLLIRTSGEMRISNFMLWQIAYTELWITDTLWPDFRRRHLFQAIAEYQRRERRFGRVD